MTASIKGRTDKSMNMGSESSEVGIGREERQVLECGGKRSATPLSSVWSRPSGSDQSNAPLRFESAVAAAALPAQSKTSSVNFGLRWQAERDAAFGPSEKRRRATLATLAAAVLKRFGWTQNCASPKLVRHEKNSRLRVDPGSGAALRLCNVRPFAYPRADQSPGPITAAQAQHHFHSGG